MSSTSMRTFSTVLVLLGPVVVFTGAEILLWETPFELPGKFSASTEAIAWIRVVLLSGAVVTGIVNRVIVEEAREWEEERGSLLWREYVRRMWTELGSTRTKSALLCSPVVLCLVLLALRAQPDTLAAVVYAFITGFFFRWLVRVGEKGERNSKSGPPTRSR